jgi:hypothetical protein
MGSSHLCDAAIVPAAGRRVSVDSMSSHDELLRWLAVARHCRGMESSVGAPATTEHRVIRLRTMGDDDGR